MIREPDGSYTGSIQTHREPVTFRIRAGRALTRAYRFDIVERPYVVRLSKTYHLPAFLHQAADKLVTEDSGDLESLIGTRVYLEIKASQKIASCQLRINWEGKTAPQQINFYPFPGDPTRLTSQESVVLTGSGEYTVNLISAQTNFENRFSPLYKVRANPYLSPRVTLDQPKGDQSVLPDELIEIKGSASADYGLAKLVQQYQINGGAQVEVVRAENTGPTATISARWDLMKLGLKPGDVVVTRLAAYNLDPAAKPSESNAIQITINSVALDAKRQQAAAARQAVLDALEAQRAAAKDLEAGVSGGRAALANPDELARREAILALAPTADALDQAAATAQRRVLQALRLAGGGRESSDLVLVGRLAGRIQHEAAGALVVEARSAADLHDPADIQARATDLVAAIGRSHAASIASLDDYRALWLGDAAVDIARDLEQLAHDQSQLLAISTVQAASDPTAWDRLARRAAVSAGLLDTVSKAMLDTAHAAAGPNAEALTKAHAEVEVARTALAKALAAKTPGAHLVPLVQALATAMTAAESRIVTLHAILSARGDKARADLAGRVGEPSAALDTLVAALAAPSTGHPIAPTLWSDAVHRLRDCAAMEDLRRDSDSSYPADLSQAALAVMTIQAAAMTDPASAPEIAKRQNADALEAARKLIRACRVIESVHALTEIVVDSQQLSTEDHFNQGAAPTVLVRTQNPTEWDWMAEGLRMLPRHFGAARLPAEMSQQVQAAMAHPPAVAISAEMAQRHLPDRALIAQDGHLASLHDELAAILAKAQVPLVGAREQLNQVAPSLADLMKKLAEQMDQMKARTDAAAKSDAPNDQAAAQAAKALDEQQAFEKELADLVDQLRRDANAQDLLTQDGRDRSRDDDDARAMLRDPPIKAESSLRQAAEAADKAARQSKLEQAAAQQQQTAKTLHTLADHYANAQAGKDDATRAAMRQAESDLGIKAAMDAEYARMEKLAEMTGENSDQLKKELEEQLAADKPMQTDLDEQAKQNAADAQAILEQAAAKEAKLANDLKAMAAAKPRGIDDIGKIAQFVADASRKLAANDLAATAQDADKGQVQVQPQLAASAQRLQAAADQAQSAAAKAATSIPAATTQLAAAAAPLLDAEKDLHAAADQAAAAARQAQADDQAAATQLAADRAHGTDTRQAATQQMQAQARQQAATRAQADAAHAAQAAHELAQTAAQLAAEQQKLAADNQAQMQAAATDQQTIADDVQQASALIAAMAEEQRELNQPDQSQALDQVAKQAADAAKDLPATGKALQKASKPDQPVGPVQDAQQKLAEAADALAKALQKPDQAQNQADQDQQSDQNQVDQSNAVSQQLASALDAIDRNNADAQLQGHEHQDGQDQNQQGQPEQNQAEKGQGEKPGAQDLPQQDAGKDPGHDAGQDPGQEPGQQQGQQPGQQPGQKPGGKPMPGQGPANQAVGAAAQAQAQAMKDSRNGQSGTSTMGSEARATAPGDPAAANPDDPGAVKTAAWGRLPLQMQRDLMDGHHEAISDEYRKQVDAYFQAIAERSRRDQPR
jgi:hypothetical protein